MNINHDTVQQCITLRVAFTTREAAAYLGVSKVSLRRWTASGQLKCVRLGTRRDRRFRKSDLDAYIRKNTTGSEKSKPRGG